MTTTPTQSTPTQSTDIKSPQSAVLDAPEACASLTEMSAEEFEARIAAVIDEASVEYLINPELTVFHTLDGKDIVLIGD